MRSARPFNRKHRAAGAIKRRMTPRSLSSQTNNARCQPSEPSPLRFDGPTGRFRFALDAVRGPTEAGPRRSFDWRVGSTRRLGWPPPSMRRRVAEVVDEDERLRRAIGYIRSTIDESGLAPQVAEVTQ